MALTRVPFDIAQTCNDGGGGEGGTATSAGRGLTTSPTRRGIKVGGGGLHTALPRVRFEVLQAHDNGGGNPNHAMITREVFVDIVMNPEDAERQAEHDLAKKRRAKPF